MQWKLVNPRKAGAALSLATAPSVVAPTYTTATISTYSLDAAGMLSIGFEAIANLSVHTDVVFMAIDVAAYTDTVQFVSEDQKSLYISRMGMGFRVALAAWNLSIDASVNLGAVAAAVQVQNAQSSLDVQVFADDVMKLPGLEAIEDLKQGSVNADFMNDLSLLAVRLTSAMTSPDGAKIQPTAVKLARIDQAEYSPLNSAISSRFAVEQVRRTKPLNNLNNWVNANGNYQGLLVPAIAAAGYSCFGVETYEATPTSDQVSAAQSLQTCGWW